MADNATAAAEVIAWAALAVSVVSAGTSGVSDRLSALEEERARRAALAHQFQLLQVGRIQHPPVAGYRHGQEIASRPEITAVFAANDQMALGVLRALHEAGRRVPEEVSVVGFDDMAESDSFWPPLTTIHQEFEAIGRRALELLVAEIEERPEPVRSSVLHTRLVVRSSTAPPPSR